MKRKPRQEIDKTDITRTKSYTDIEIIKRTLRYMKPVRGKFALGLVLILFNVALSILLLRILGIFTDYIDETTMLSHDHPLGMLLLIVSSYLVVIVSNMVLVFFETVLIQKAGQEVIFTLRQEAFEKIETFSHEQLSKIPVGRLVTRVTNDTNALNQLYTNVLVNLLRYSLTLVGIFVNMVFINPFLSLWMTLILAVFIAATGVYRKVAKKAFDRRRKENSNLNTFLNENLSGMKVTQAFVQEDRKLREFKETNNNLRKAHYGIMYVFALYRPFITLLYYGAIALVFFVGMQHVNAKEVFFGTTFTYGMLTSYYNYTASFFGPIQNLAETFDQLQSGLVASERIFNILDMESTVKDTENARPIEHFKGKIEFRHVYFAYEKEDWILKDVSFVVEPGQTVAFIGATGAGETTILSLIVRNYDIQKGQILIDDVDIKDIEIASLRRRTGQMLQDVFLFAGTIKDNISLREESITDEEIQAASSYVNADQFISKLPLGFDTEVVEGGANFSAGQRQLISFARTVVAKPEILILDEATANIDTETETLIQDSLEKMKSIGTMLVVAHRLSTIQHSDNIICLSHGEILEQGNHQQLLAKKGYYHKLYQLQFEERK